ncbi:hypothetical protein ACFQ1M_02030 [Sungkyunkwania multivorans]|uniref:Transmembrane protein n=1 Tax=Sungkyunkwania multivorans TaxID=1173618 RepID=A0ABW3CVW0_9FLAO
MNEFEELQATWRGQKDVEDSTNSDTVIAEAERLSKKLKKNRRWTLAILAATILILMAFAIYVKVYRSIQPTVGIALMILGVVLRLVIEYRDIQRFSKIERTASLKAYAEQMFGYHSSRKTVHFVFTPIILLAYVLGFYLMLPSFKASLSAGFYLYIVISAIVLLIVYSFFFYREARKELDMLSYLSSIE